MYRSDSYNHGNNHNQPIRDTKMSLSTCCKWKRACSDTANPRISEDLRYLINPRLLLGGLGQSSVLDDLPITFKILRKFSDDLRITSGNFRKANRHCFAMLVKRPGIIATSLVNSSEKNNALSEVTFSFNKTLQFTHILWLHIKQHFVSFKHWKWKRLFTLARVCYDHNLEFVKVLYN